MQKETNKTTNERKKKHIGIKVAVVVILLVLVVECCFNTKDYSETPVESSANSVVSTETEKTEVKENEVVESEATEAETETTKVEETETPDSALEAELLAEQGIYITPGSTFYTTEGGYNNDRTLYLNVLYEDDNTMRYVGWGYDESGNIDESVHVDVLMKQVETDKFDVATWKSEDGIWAAHYVSDDENNGPQFGQQENYDSDFFGYFVRVTDDSSASSGTTTGEITILNSNAELRDFIRDESNIGKVATVDIYAAETSSNPFYAYTLWDDGADTYLYVENNSSTNILHGDYATITGIFKGFKYGEALFEATSIELLETK